MCWVMGVPKPSQPPWVENSISRYYVSIMNYLYEIFQPTVFTQKPSLVAPNTQVRSTSHASKKQNKNKKQAIAFENFGLGENCLQLELISSFPVIIKKKKKKIDVHQLHSPGNNPRGLPKHTKKCTLGCGIFEKMSRRKFFKNAKDKKKKKKKKKTISLEKTATWQMKFSTGKPAYCPEISKNAPVPFSTLPNKESTFVFSSPPPKLRKSKNQFLPSILVKMEKKGDF